MCRDSHGGVWVLSQSETMSDFQLRCGNVAFGPTCHSNVSQGHTEGQAARRSLDRHSGHQSFELFFFGGVGVDTESCVVWSGFTLTMWLRVTLNSLPPGPRDDRVKPLSPLWRQILNYSFS